MKTMKEFWEENKAELSKLVALGPWFTTGSCEFNGEGNDLDVVVLVDSLDDPASRGYVRTDASRYGGYDRCCYRKGSLNLIAVRTHEHYSDWQLASEICKKIAQRQGGTINKADRCFIHRLLVDLATVPDAFNQTKDLI